MELKTVAIENPDGLSLILGLSHFLKDNIHHRKDLLRWFGYKLA